MKKLVYLVGLCLSVSLATSATARAANPLTHEYKLNNGMKIIIREDHRAPVVVSQIWYRVGSGLEPNGLTGVSHVLEHMMFKGTKQYPDGQFSKIIAANGGKENAFTGADFTAYYQALEASRYPLSFRLEADRMQNLVLREKDFAKEIEVVKEERRMRVDDNPQARTYERFVAAAHLTAPYHHMTIGWMNDLDNLKLDDLKKWYKTWYAPNNAILIVVGDVQPQAVLAQAKKYFGGLKPSVLPDVKPQRSPKPLGKRHVEVNVPAKLSFLMMGFNVPSLHTIQDKQEAYALDVLVGILDAGDSARFSAELIRGRQVAASASVDYDLVQRFDGLLTFSGVPAEGHTVDELQQAFQAQINRLKDNLVSQEELDRVKAQVVASKVFSRDSLFGQTMMMGLLETVGLSWKDGESYADNVNAITAEQIQQVAKKYLSNERLTTAVLVPQSLQHEAVKGDKNASK